MFTTVEVIDVVTAAICTCCCLASVAPVTVPITMQMQRTILHVYASSGNNKGLELLMERGADVNAQDEVREATTCECASYSVTCFKESGCWNCPRRALHVGPTWLIGDTRSWMLPTLLALTGFARCHVSARKGANIRYLGAFLCGGSGECMWKACGGDAYSRHVRNIHVVLPLG
jgi:hypothetical protein